MSHEAVEPEFHELIDEHAVVRRLGTGYAFTEGPIWHPLEKHLLFSDMPGDVRRRLDPDGTIREVMRPSNKGNGMTYDHDLNLIVCEHSTSSLVRFSPDGHREVLAATFEGIELNSPNDTCLRSCGSIYFTDPWYGRMPGFGVERPRVRGWQGVFRVRPGEHYRAEPDLVVDRYLFAQPNGLCFSPDERLLYVNDTVQANVRVFDVQPDGTLRNGRLFATGIKDAALPGVPDGMKCDARGNVWVTAPGGLWVYSPDGRLLGKVRVPELVANLHWGGDDWRTLYVCASTSLYAVDTRVTGRTEPFMTAGGATGPDGRTADAGALRLDAGRCALIVQDMQNDVVSEGGAFADSGSPRHCREQDAVANVARLAAACREKGIPVIHVWFVCDPGYPGLTLNAPLFEGLVDSEALVRGTWGAAPVDGLAPEPGDFIVNKMRMSAWEGTTLETILRAEDRDLVIVTGAWTNMSIEHTARTGADKGYTMVVPEDACATMNAEWHRASIDFALQNVSAVTRVDDVLAGLGSA